MTKLRDIWEATSFELEKLQTNVECVKEEQKGLALREIPNWKLTFTPHLELSGIPKDFVPAVGIIREEGSHGDRELSAAFYYAGFSVWDIKMSDLKSGFITLDKFVGIAFPGGFSYADVMDSAKGWAGSIIHNKILLEQFQSFFNRPDTFSLGICNGCQLMALLGWVPYSGVPLVKQPRFIHNTSGRFESRYVAVRIESSPSIFFKDMEGSTLGVWIQHGEGRAHFPDPSILETVLSRNLAPLRYVNDSNEISIEYPFNPNGSILGIAGLCTPDGRHLSVMPHPERSFLKWQLPWVPESWEKFEESPWLKMFQNARIWVHHHNLK